MTDRLSYNAKKVLIDIRDGRGTHAMCKGKSAHGGRARILQALQRRGFIDGDYKITKAGRAYLEAR